MSSDHSRVSTCCWLSVRDLRTSDCLVSSCNLHKRTQKHMHLFISLRYLFVVDLRPTSSKGALYGRSESCPRSQQRMDTSVCSTVSSHWSNTRSRAAAIRTSLRSSSLELYIFVQAWV